VQLSSANLLWLVEPLDKGRVGLVKGKVGVYNMIDYLLSRQG
jgi:hypothetical protein